MNGQHIPGTPVVVDFWRLRDVPPRCLFFLTHMHADHTSGLSASWPYPVHCSPVTGRLLKRKFKINPKLVVELEVGESRMLYVNCPGVPVTVTVTTLDANHCPGSVMFLFEGYFGSILYTGDFRLSPSMLTHPLLNGSRAIDVLYLDNTYCHPSCQFPTRDVVAKAIVELIRDNPECMYLIGLHNLGKEDLLVTLATEIGTWVGVSPERYETLKELEMPAVFSTELGQCQISVYPFHMVAKSMLSEMNSASSAIAILPTCLFSGAGAPASPSNPNIRVFPYSDHSSYDELRQFVGSVRPRSVQPVVRNFTGERRTIFTRCNMGVFADLLDPSPPHKFEIPAAVDRLLSMKAQSQRTPRQMSTPPLILRRRSLTSSGSRATKSRAKGVQFVSPLKKSRPLKEVTEGGASKDEEERTVKAGNPVDRENLSSANPKLSDKSNPVKPPERCRYKPLLFASSSETISQVEIPESGTRNPNSESRDRPVLENGLAGPEPVTADGMGVLQSRDIEMMGQVGESPPLNFILQEAQGNVEFEDESAESEISLVIEAVEGNVEMSPEDDSEMSALFRSENSAAVTSSDTAVRGSGLRSNSYNLRPRVQPQASPLLEACFLTPLQVRRIDLVSPDSCERCIKKELNPFFFTCVSKAAKTARKAPVSSRAGDKTRCDVRDVCSPQTGGEVCLPSPAARLSHQALLPPQSSPVSPAGRETETETESPLPHEALLPTQTPPLLPAGRETETETESPLPHEALLPTQASPLLPAGRETETETESPLPHEALLPTQASPLLPAGGETETETEAPVVKSPLPNEPRSERDIVAEMAVSTAIAWKLRKNTKRGVKRKAVSPKHYDPPCTCRATSSKRPEVCLVGLEEFFSNSVSSTADFMTPKEFEQWVCDL